MRHIYHILPRTSWQPTDPSPLRADSLQTEGFVHCSNRDQVEWVANQFYADAADLVVAVIDAARLTSPLRDEDPGIGQTFPHVYGPIDRQAIIGLEPLTRGSDGRWSFPAANEKTHRQGEPGA